ncbi:YrbA [Buchnera aphidicola str. Bp (Baizongia pistaciae)]|uniref:Uncharacterized protein bbp_348 n=1 Tax=Buchnera aphidicola subsp. Baizongia pistaciae (strain Bp) TaxID=224915 RepID=Y348_BUCBP|nr:BolA/IbaG family iron-sulfur metabolism protein [Buchnera aphidicola]Q89AF0.1 RecName: Full=Uncharacterized protein bbp_348 [Buchnera aphidicola str. Bp (Baizongia pistaciae)]AAO27067.1 YrbA [Buchnera aphidicola str. Bp (Baizongia pistaciae)]
MTITNTIKSLLKKKIPLTVIHVTGDNKHINITAVSDIFNNINTLRRQQIIYKPLMPYIINKTLHAISIKTYSLQEWKNK